jgi:hypothetical protein
MNIHDAIKNYRATISRSDTLDLSIATMTLLYAAQLALEMFEARDKDNTPDEVANIDDEAREELERYFMACYWSQAEDTHDLDEHPVFKHSGAADLTPTEVHHRLAIHPGISMCEVTQSDNFEFIKALTGASGFVTFERLVEPSTHAFLCKQTAKQACDLVHMLVRAAKMHVELSDLPSSDNERFELTKHARAALTLHFGNEVSAETRLAIWRLKSETTGPYVEVFGSGLGYQLVGVCRGALKLIYKELAQELELERQELGWR